jgi:two-component system OmpR family sensor kinase
MFPQSGPPQSTSRRLAQRLRDIPRRTPLRVKLVAAMLALVALALAVISAASVAIYHNYLIGQASQQLTSTFQGVLQEAQSRNLPMRPRDISMIGYNTVVILRPANGQLDPNDRRPSTLPNVPAQPAWLSANAGQPVTVSSVPSGNNWLVITQPMLYQLVDPLTQQVVSRQQVTLIVGMDLSTIDRTIGRLVYIDIVASLIIMTALAMAGVAAVRQSLRPLSDIEKTAQAIAAGDLSRRVPDADPRTELGSLGRSLNTMLAQIEAAFHDRAKSEIAARQSEERMRRFVADASHELRTPLTAIRGYAEYYRQRGGIPGGEPGSSPSGAQSRNGAAGAPSARDTAGGPAAPATPADPGHAGNGAQGRGAGAISGADMNRIMERVEQESARMGILVEDLLLLARLDQQRPLDRRPVDLLTLAADAVQDARMIAPGRTIDLSVAAGPAFLVLGDEVRLRQVIGNLMSNALTHTPDGTPVRVRLRSGALTLPGRPAAPGAVLEVADEGPGLQPEQAERVFERFYRADQARTRQKGGTGLGLAIVAALVAAHGGTVAVDTAPGRGATFRITLPLAPETQEPAAGSPTP